MRLVWEEEVVEEMYGAEENEGKYYGHLNEVYVMQMVRILPPKSKRQGYFNVKAFYVHQDNRYFKSVKGVLYDKTMNTLIAYPAGNEDVTLFQVPNTVTHIADYAFGCAYMHTIKLPRKLKTLGEKVFCECRNLTSIKLPDELQCLPADTFEGCTALHTIKLPEQLISIEEGAIVDAPITKLYIPKNLQTIAYRNIPSLPYLQHISVDPQNKYFAAKDGILYDKNFTTILAYPPAKTADSFTIPPTVHTIDSHAFRCSKLKCIYIPNSVHTIKHRAFSECRYLVSILTYGQATHFQHDNVDNIIQQFQIPDDHHSCIIQAAAKDKPKGTLGSYAFSHLIRLTTLMIPDDIHFLDHRSITSCKFLENVKLPPNLQYVGMRVFETGEYDLSFFTHTTDEPLHTPFNLDYTNFHIPQHLQYIEPTAFDTHQHVQHFNVHPDNKYFSAHEGVLYSKDKTTLIMYPKAKTTTDTFTVPTSVKHIRAYAFEGSRKLHRIVLHEHIQTIEDGDKIYTGGQHFNEYLQLITDYEN
jgi:hypothetical protein